ncbi:MAG: Y-family DNA polymerase [Candidatus Puniceispirillaceae bacterium]
MARSASYEPPVQPLLKTGRHARFIYIYLPDIAVHRLVRCHQLDEGVPVAVYHQVKGADRLVYCSPSAASFGLVPDMSLSDARALCALCRFYPHDEAADRKWLAKLGQWCWRYSPVVGVSPDHLGLWIDSTAADHLFGGEANMLADMAQHFSNQAITAHIAMASYYAAALAVAMAMRPESPVIVADNAEAHQQALDPLPLSAMRLPRAQCDALAQLGLLKIGDLKPLKRGSLAMRFGDDILRRRDALFGDVPERPVPLEQLQPVLIQQHYQDPIGGIESLNQMVDGLLCGLCEMLEQMMLACRHVEIGWQTTDRQGGEIRHNLSRPSRDIALFRRLFQDAGASIDAGFGIEYSWVKAKSLNAQMAKPTLFNFTGKPQDSAPDKALSDLVDHLTARLGPERVMSLQMVENWVPEQSEKLIKAQSHQQALYQAGTSASDDAFAFDDGIPEQSQSLHTDEADPPNRSFGQFEFASHDGVGTPRPLRLLSVPEPIQAIALLPDHPPSQIRWRHKNWRIRRATGPERIGPRWWESYLSTDDRMTRDYYRLETEAGIRLWVYRAGLPDRNDAISWYLHGFFA